MPRITHVKKAQQRYATVPKLDENGEQIVVAVLRKDGTPKTTRAKVGRPARPIVRRLTVDDLDQPLPPYTCDSCREPIVIGSPYKHISPKSGPYGGKQRNRHESCPSWQVWEYSSSLSARIAQIQHGFSEGVDQEWESAEDVQSFLAECAEEVRSIAEEKEEGANNIEEGFGHETSQSEELKGIAEELNNWADEIENTEVPDYPEPEPETCGDCTGKGTVDNPEFDPENKESDEPEEISCEECDGSGEVDADEPDEDQIEAWHDEVSGIFGVLDESPV